MEVDKYLEFNCARFGNHNIGLYILIIEILYKGIGKHGPSCMP